ncbi:MAG TPA: class IV adenylate cyclase, partial [Candidatus Eisenbacteria bacterium]|nr:class IV adenylate cyclase [Candidatus Eisenbacteria bacterium]
DRSPPSACCFPEREDGVVEDGLEVEIKLKVGDLVHRQDRIASTKSRLEEMGASLVHPREFEDNLAFDFPDRPIVRTGSLLLVRILARGTRLIFKGPLAPLDGLIGARHETELTIQFDETDALLAIIRGLGMQPVFRYQKYRTTWNWKGVHVVIDETPIGLYLELEGERTLIEAGAKALGFGPDDFVTKSYRDLYLEHLDQGAQGLQGSRSADRMLFESP